MARVVRGAAARSSVDASLELIDTLVRAVRLVRKPKRVEPIAVVVLHPGKWTVAMINKQTVLG